MTYALLGLLLIVGPVIYAVAGVYFSRKILHGKVQEGHNDVCVPIFLNAGVLFAVLLGFMVVAVWESYDVAKTTAATEATALVPLYRAAGNLPPEAGDKIRALVREYIHQVIEDEWPLQAESGKASSKARKQIGDLFRAFGNGTITTDMKKNFPLSCNVVMQAISDVSNDRNKRNLEANEDVPTVMWFAILGGAWVIVSMSFVIYMERPLPHMLMAGLMALLIGLLLYSCLILSEPFRGPIAISPEAFEKTLVVLDDVDRGN
jgi:Protein of unknown function (DUF4239)